MYKGGYIFTSITTIGQSTFNRGNHLCVLLTTTAALTNISLCCSHQTAIYVLGFIYTNIYNNRTNMQL